MSKYEEELMKLREAHKEMTKDLPPRLAKMADETFEFRHTLNHESDRGCALMAASYLDEQLKLLLEENLVENKKIADGLFDFNGAIGTFSSRIDMSYMMGLLPESVRKDLHLIRKIRNEFAHNPQPMDFDTQKLNDLCMNLVHDGFLDKVTAKKKFRRATMGVLAAIHGTRTNSKYKEPAPEPDLNEARKGMATIIEKMTTLMRK